MARFYCDLITVDGSASSRYKYLRYLRKLSNTRGLIYSSSSILSASIKMFIREIHYGGKQNITFRGSLLGNGLVNRILRRNKLRLYVK